MRRATRAGVAASRAPSSPASAGAAARRRRAARRSSAPSFHGTALSAAVLAAAAAASSASRVAVASVPSSQIERPSGSATTARANVRSGMSDSSSGTIIGPTRRRPRAHEQRAVRLGVADRARGLDAVARAVARHAQRGAEAAVLLVEEERPELARNAATASACAAASASAPAGRRSEKRPARRRGPRRAAASRPRARARARVGVRERRRRRGVGLVAAAARSARGTTRRARPSAFEERTRSVSAHARDLHAHARPQRAGGTAQRGQADGDHRRRSRPPRQPAKWGSQASRFFCSLPVAAALRGHPVGRAPRSR